MQYVTLGKTGLKISRLGFGGIPIQRTDAKTTTQLVKAMAEKGINYIDTARGYTVSEGYLGEALEGLRDKFILATKSMAQKRQWLRILRSVSEIFVPTISISIRSTTRV